MSHERKKKIFSAIVFFSCLFFLILAGISGSWDSQERLLIGTDNGVILDYDDGKMRKIAELNGTVHEIKTYEGDIYASTQASNSSNLYRVTGNDKDLVFRSDENFHGFELIKDHLYLGLEEKEEVIKISSSGDIVSKSKLKGKPHQIDSRRNKLYIGLINGNISVLDTELENKDNIEIGSWLGSFSINNQRLTAAGRRKVKLNTSGHIHEVTRGRVVSLTERDETAMDLDVTVVPHGVAMLEENNAAVSNMVNGTVKIVDLNEKSVESTVALEPRGEPYFTSLLKKYDNYIVAGDIEKSRIYFIDKEKGVVEKSVYIEGLHSIQTS